MKKLSTLNILLPLVLFIAACALSLPTLLIALIWITIGVVSLGHRSLESFPRNGVRREWLKGYRGACLWFYHLAWWPWYMRAHLRNIARRIGEPLLRRKSPRHGTDNLGRREENRPRDTQRGRWD